MPVNPRDFLCSAVKSFYPEKEVGFSVAGGSDTVLVQIPEVGELEVKAINPLLTTKMPFGIGHQVVLVEGLNGSPRELCTEEDLHPSEPDTYTRDWLFSRANVPTGLMGQPVGSGFSQCPTLLGWWASWRASLNGRRSLVITEESPGSGFNVFFEIIRSLACVVKDFTFKAQILSVGECFSDDFSWSEYEERPSLLFIYGFGEHTPPHILGKLQGLISRRHGHRRSVLVYGHPRSTRPLAVMDSEVYHVAYEARQADVLGLPASILNTFKVIP